VRSKRFFQLFEIGGAPTLSSVWRMRVTFTPFIELIIKGGVWREAFMVWSPIFGAVLGILFYSVLIGVIAAVLVAQEIARWISPNRIPVAHVD
jgi:hypothetical protein